MKYSQITAEDVRRALEQRAEIDLVSEGKVRIVYDAYLQLFRVFDGGREHRATDSTVAASAAYNDLVTGR